MTDQSEKFGSMSLDEKANIFRRTRLAFERTSLENKAQLFFQRGSEPRRTNSALQELRMSVNFLMAASLISQGRGIINEIGSPIWERLILSGNVRRTKRRYDLKGLEFIEQVRRWRTFLAEENFLVKIETEAGPEVAWLIAAKTLLRFLQHIRMFTSNPQPVEVESDSSLPFSEKNLLDHLTQLGFRSEDVVLTLFDDIVTLGIEVCETAIADINKQVIRPDQHIFSKNVCVGSEDCAFFLRFVGAHGAEIDPVYARDAQKGLHVYFFLGAKSTLILLIAGVPTTVLALMARVFPQLGHMYKSFMGHSISERIASKVDPHFLIKSKLLKSKHGRRKA